MFTDRRSDERYFGDSSNSKKAISPQ